MTTPTATTNAEHTDSLILRELAAGPRSVTDLCIAINHTDPRDQKRVDNRLQSLKQRSSVGNFGKRWHLLDATGKPVHPPESTIAGAVKVTPGPVLKAAGPANGTRGVPSGTPVVPPAAPPPPAKPVDVSERERADAATRLENAEARRYLRGGLVAVLEALGRRPNRELLDDELVDQAKRAAAERNVALASAESAMQLLRDIAREVGDEDADNHTGPALASRVVRAIQDLRAEGDEADAALKVAVGERNVALDQLSDVDRRLGLTDPHTVEERELLIAELRAAAIEAMSLQQRLATAQDVIRRLEQDVVAANKEAADLRDTLIDVCGKADPAAEAQRAEPILPGWWDPDTRQPFPEWKVVHVVEIEESQKYLRDAQGEIQRLEGLLRRAEAQRQVAETHARAPHQRYDEVVDDVWHKLACDLGMLIMGGESTGADIALRALRALHDAQKFLLALRVHHNALVGDEVAA